MRPFRIVNHQKIEAVKKARSLELRKHMTQAEELLWQALRHNRLNGLHFRHQQIIDGFITDFYCHKAALVIEIDGPIHIKQKDYDQDRDQILNIKGIQVLRFNNDDVEQNLENVLATITDACLNKAASSDAKDQ